METAQKPIANAEKAVPIMVVGIMYLSVEFFEKVELVACDHFPNED